jgi:hypothetical protein
MDYFSLTPDELLIECLTQIQDYSDRALAGDGQRQVEIPTSDVALRSQNAADCGEQIPPSRDVSVKQDSPLSTEPKTSLLQ